MDTNEIMITIVIPLAVLLATSISFGFITRLLGASFGWGFWLGPLGVIVGAIVGANKRRERQTQAMMRMMSHTSLGRVRTVPRTAQPAETDVERFNRLYEGGEAPQKPRKKIYIRR
jgi:HAMP domain-containing protein